MLDLRNARVVFVAILQSCQHVDSFFLVPVGIKPPKITVSRQLEKVLCCAPWRLWQEWKRDQRDQRKDILERNRESPNNLKDISMDPSLDA